jgi:hypothetical protein
LITHPLSPLQPEVLLKMDIYIGWRGELRREGASPPLMFLPPLKHDKKTSLKVKLV